MKTKPPVITKVAEIYKWLDSQSRRPGSNCKACGKCCDFHGYDHRLFVTTGELIYLIQKIGTHNLRPMTGRICPYNENGKCTIHKFRFVACRIFFCSGNIELQRRISEQAVQKFKNLCVKYRIPYRYGNLADMLNNFALKE